MKQILGVSFSRIAASTFAAASLFAGVASATQGQLLQCDSADHGVAARVALGTGQYQPQVTVYKLGPGLPFYRFACLTAPTGGGWLNCSDASNRTFILNQDYTARYIGSHETHELVCRPSGFSAD